MPSYYILLHCYNPSFSHKQQLALDIVGNGENYFLGDFNPERIDRLVEIVGFVTDVDVSTSFSGSIPETFVPLYHFPRAPPRPLKPARRKRTCSTSFASDNFFSTMLFFFSTSSGPRV